MKMPRRAAFTLLEVLLALALSTLIAASLFAILRVAFKAKSSTEEALEPSRTADIAMNLIRADLENALPPAGTFAGSFIGTDSTDDRGLPGDTLTFYAASSGPNRVSTGDIKEIGLGVLSSDGSSDYSLIRQVTSNLLPTPSQEVDPDEEVLCRGVSGFNLRYFDGTDWQDSWDSTQQQNTLPAAVEVTITLERPGAGGAMQTLDFVRIFSLSCAAPATDDAGSGSGSGTTGGDGAAAPAGGGPKGVSK